MPDNRTSLIADQLRAEDRDRYIMALMCPADRRAGVMALYAFDSELARIRGRVSEALIGRIKMQWWRDVIADIYAGKGAPKGNPLTEALAETIVRHHLTRDHFDALIAVRERDMAADDDGAAPKTVDDLENYAEGTQARINWLVLEALGVSDQISKQAARHVGITYALTGLLRAVAFEARTGPGKIPLAAGAPLRELTTTMAERAAAHLVKARALRSQVDRGAVPALLPAVTAGSYLKQLAAHDGDPVRVDPIGQANVAALMWSWLTGRY